MTTTRQMAKLAGVAEQTVRNWTRDYSALLSPEACGERGPRRFSDADVQVFLSIVELRREDIPPAEVIERLQRGDIYINTTPQQATPSPQEAPGDVLAWQQVERDLQRQIDALRRAQRVQVRNALWSHGVAFYLGLITMGVIFWLVWLLNQWWYGA